MTTIRDVAKVAGVSPATVSRYLSQDKSFQISEETRTKIDQATKDLNYVYKPKKKKEKELRLGVIMAQTSEKYSDPFFNSILVSIEDECLKYNCKLVNVTHYDDINENSLKNIFKLRLDGIFLLEELPDKHMNLIIDNIDNIIGIDYEATHFNTIGYDIFNSTINALDYLMSKGHRRVAYVGGGSAKHHFNQSTKVCAYHECMRRLGKQKYKHLLYDTNWELDRVVKSAEDIFSSTPLPDAIFAGSDTVAAVILSIAYEKGIKIPEDISILGFNNIPNSALTIPPLSTVNVPTTLMGSLAVKRMMEVLDGDVNIYNTLVQTQIIERKSVKTNE